MTRRVALAAGLAAHQVEVVDGREEAGEDDAAIVRALLGLDRVPLRDAVHHRVRVPGGVAEDQVAAGRPLDEGGAARMRDGGGCAADSVGKSRRARRGPVGVQQQECVLLERLVGGRDARVALHQPVELLDQRRDGANHLLRLVVDVVGPEVRELARVGPVLAEEGQERVGGAGGTEHGRHLVAVVLEEALRASTPSR